jgi:dipeptidyl aminopeptidase/acylaminoacyl peptidase
VEGQHSVERLSLASPRGVDAARRVAIELYRPFTPAPSPVVLLLPSAGGSYWIERSFARYFADRGYAAVLLRRDELRPGEKVIEAVDDLLRQSVLDGARVLDWVATRPDLDARRIGLFGISMGGIKGAVFAPLEPRIGAAVLGLAGGDLPVIMTQTTEPGVAAERRAWLATTGLDLAGAERELRRRVRHDPLEHAAHADPRRFLLILARFDQAVPTANGWQLWAALGKPETIVLPTGHYTAVLAMPWLKPAILQFFDRTLAPAPPGPAPEA